MLGVRSAAGSSGFRIYCSPAAPFGGTPGQCNKRFLDGFFNPAGAGNSERPFARQ